MAVWATVVGETWVEGITPLGSGNTVVVCGVASLSEAWGAGSVAEACTGSEDEAVA